MLKNQMSELCSCTDVKLDTKRVEFFRIDMLLTSSRLVLVLQYLTNSSFMVFSSLAKRHNISRAVHLLEPVLNKELSSLYDLFINNKLNIHFGEYKSKSLLSGKKRLLKNQMDLNITHSDIEIKQQSKVTYLECVLDSNFSGETIATKVINLVNGRLQNVVQMFLKI